MSEQDFFKSALADFTFEAASGGAIRHMADLGYTVKQITEQLSFPTPYERVQKAVWERLLETGVLLLEEPGSGKRYQAAPVYVVDHDKYGRASFRRARVAEEAPERVLWRERTFDEKRDGRPEAFLAEKCAQNGGENSFLYCDFGSRMAKEPALLQRRLQALDKRQRDYIYGLFQGQGDCYHRLDGRMREIAARMFEYGEYHTVCYFMKSEEKFVF